MRILIAEPVKEACSALRLFLGQQAGCDVIGEVCQSEQLLDRVVLEKPDVLLVDWGMLGREPVALLREMKAVHDPLYVIVLSTRPERRLQALQAGANAFVSKGDWPERMLKALSESKNLGVQMPEGWGGAKLAETRG